MSQRGRGGYYPSAVLTGHPRRGLLAVAIVAATLLVTAPAEGQVRAAVELDLEGETPAEVEASLLEALAAGLRPAVSRILSEAEAGAAEVLLRVSFLQLEQHYSVEVDLHLDRDSAPLATSALECPACTWDEALSAVTRAAQGVTSSLPGFLTIVVSPPEATVRVDGEDRPLGRALSLGPGAHRVEARLEGHQPVSREVTIRPATRSEISLELIEAIPSTPPEAPEATRPLQLAAWLTGAGGLAALIPGVLWLAIDGECPLSWSENGPCPEVYDTWPQGLGVTLVGAALLSTSIALFITAARRRRPPAVSAAVDLSPSGAFGVIRGLF